MPYAALPHMGAYFSKSGIRTSHGGPGAADELRLNGSGNGAISASHW